jgi:hypothetical protein
MLLLLRMQLLMSESNAGPDSHKAQDTWELG